MVDRQHRYQGQCRLVPAGSTAYLFVVTPNGVSNGYPVTIAGNTTCVHQSEQAPCDGCIDTSELFTFINTWKSSSAVTIAEVIEAIRIWKGEADERLISG